MALKSIDQAPAELQASIREFFPQEQWDNAASVSYLESGWDVWAEANTVTDAQPCGSTLRTMNGTRVTAEHSVSWFQINACNYPDWPWYFWFNTRLNVGEAHALWARRGWQPWFFSAQTLGLL